MRDNHEGMIELSDAFERDGHFFVVIEKESRKFQFGVSRNGYLAIRRAIQIRPFDAMPGLKYRYFYAGSQRRKAGTEDYSMSVRIELNRDASKVTIDIPKDLHANLLWFDRLEDLGEADYLKMTTNDPES